MDKQAPEKVEIPGVGLWPRRQSVQHLTETELQIARCIDAVEKLGASLSLTCCVNHLTLAKDCLADHIESEVAE